MIDTWQADGLKVFGENRNTFALTIGLQTYLLGPGVSAPNFKMTRPAKIQRMGIQMDDSNPAQPPERPIDVLDYNGWATIPVKNIQGGYPLQCWVEYNVPNITLNFWQIPGLNCSAVVYSWQPISTFPDFTTDVTFPPAYAEAIKYNLAVRFAAEFKTQPDQIVIGLAASTLDAITTSNLRAPVLSCEPGWNAGGGYYDWRSDSVIVNK